MKGYMSASGIKRHAECPKSWWFRYVSDQEPVEAETKYLDLGNAVHEAIEGYLRGVYGDGPEYDPLSRYKTFGMRYGVPDDLWEDGIECVERAVEFVEDEQPDILGIEAEEEFVVDRPDLHERFTAKIDVATEGEIWDWKTGQIRDNTAIQEKIQGAVYMAAYRSKYGHAPEAIRFLYLKEEEKRTIRPTDDVWQYMVGHARRLAMHKDEGEFEAKPGDFCHWCGYEQFCTEAGGVGTEFDWERWTAL